MSWSGAGIPVIGGTVLSGAQTIVFKGSRYLVEHPVVGLEGGIVENLGKPQTRIEVHGIAYESGADKMLAILSGYIQSGFQEFHVPSFNSGYYFIQSGAGIQFENLKFIYDAGHGYPFYHYIIAGVLSGEINISAAVPPNPVIQLPSGFASFTIATDQTNYYVSTEGDSARSIVKFGFSGDTLATFIPFSGSATNFDDFTGLYWDGGNLYGGVSKNTGNATHYAWKLDSSFGITARKDIQSGATPANWVFTIAQNGNIYTNHATSGTFNEYNNDFSSLLNKLNAGATAADIQYDGTNVWWGTSQVFATDTSVNLVASGLTLVAELSNVSGKMYGVDDNVIRGPLVISGNVIDEPLFLAVLSGGTFLKDMIVVGSTLYVAQITTINNKVTIAKYSYPNASGNLLKAYDISGEGLTTPLGEFVNMISYKGFPKLLTKTHIYDVQALIS